MGEKRENGAQPPLPLQSFPLQQCLVIFIYWDDFARNPVAWLCPPQHTHTHTLWYVAWFLAGCPQRKRGQRVSQRDPHRKIHTPRNTTHHTIYTYTHKQHTRWCTGQVRGVVSGGWGVQALIIIKGPMICFLHYLLERGSHLNEYQINTLKSLWRAFHCHVQFLCC